MNMPDNLQTFGEQVIEFHLNLEPPAKLPEGISWIDNLDQVETQQCLRNFYSTYFSDRQPRLFLFGINPGRFGAGLTGVGFTDPVYLEDRCGIPNSFPRRHELSSHFIYTMIEAYGTVDAFYRQHYITALSPIGLLKNGKNYNYYDDADTLQVVEPFVIDCVNAQIGFGALRTRAVCIGMGTNYRYFSELNQRMGWFDQIIPLPHPRWVMQYKRKEINRYVEEYLAVLV